MILELKEKEKKKKGERDKKKEIFGHAFLASYSSTSISLETSISFIRSTNKKH